MTTSSPRIAALLLLASSTACWVPLEKGRQMEARLDALDSEQADTRKRLEEERAILKDRIAKADAKIAEVQKKIDELNQAARRSGADLAVNQQRLQDDQARLRGDLEVSQHQLQDIQKGLLELKSDTEGKLAALKGAGALDEYQARQLVAAMDKPDDKGAFFALAQKQEQTGDKGVARELYQQYVRRWPNDPRSAEAGFHAGDLLASQKRWREAILAYGKVAEDYPRSERAPDALGQLAEAMLQLDMKDDARAILGQVVEKYPKSAAAARARKRLAELSEPVKPAAQKKPAKKK